MTTRTAVRDLRRRLVAALMVRRPNITQRELRDLIGKQVVSPDTGQPYSLGTINNDIKEVRKLWRGKAARDYGVWVFEELAKLDEVEAEAWKQGKLDIVLKCMARRAKLLGLDELDRSTVDWRREVVDLLRRGLVTREEVRDEFGGELARELFESAGLAVAPSGTDGEPEAEGES